MEPVASLAQAFCHAIGILATRSHSSLQLRFSAFASISISRSDISESERSDGVLVYEGKTKGEAGPARGANPRAHAAIDHPCNPSSASPSPRE